MKKIKSMSVVAHIHAILRDILLILTGIVLVLILGVVILVKISAYECHTKLDDGTRTQAEINALCQEVADLD